MKEPGWLNTQLSKSWLAVVPGYSHYNLITSPEVPQIVAKFLADPLTKPPTGAWPASICFFSPSPCTHSPAEYQQAACDNPASGHSDSDACPLSPQSN